MSRETDFLSFPLQREWKQTLSFKSWQSYVAEGSSSFVEANTLPASTDWSPAGSKSFCCGFTKTLALCCSADHQHQIDVWLLGRRSWPWSTRGCYAGCKCIIQELPAWKNTSLPPFWPGLREPGGTGVCFVTWKAAMAFQSNITTEYLLALSNEMPKSTNRKWSRKFFFFFLSPFPTASEKEETRYFMSLLKSLFCKNKWRSIACYTLPESEGLRKRTALGFLMDGVEGQTSPLL